MKYIISSENPSTEIELFFMLKLMVIYSQYLQKIIRNNASFIMPILYIYIYINFKSSIFL
jgi:hypothetical protein